MLKETKFLSKQSIKEIEELRKAIQNTYIKITCMGLYNAGKSTLLNTLIGDFEHKTFKAADKRETTENKEVILEKEGLIVVDTPGLNAKDDDDKRVMDAIKTSDINLFVHNIATGEFQAKEVEFFELVKKHWANPKEFIKSTVFVLSRADEKSSEEIEDIKKIMKQQIKDYFGVEAIFVVVSAKRYTKGMVENKKLLIKRSNIEMLKDIIRDLKEARKKEIIKTKKERLIKKYQSLIKYLKSEREKNLLEISLLKGKLEKKEKAFQEDIERIKSTLRNYYKRLESV